MDETLCVSLNLYIYFKNNIVGAMLAGGKRLSPTVADSGDRVSMPSR